MAYTGHLVSLPVVRAPIQQCGHSQSRSDPDCFRLGSQARLCFPGGSWGVVGACLHPPLFPHSSTDAAQQTGLCSRAHLRLP